MSTNDHEHNPAPGPNTGLGRPLKVALGMMAVIGGFYLLREHWSHVGGNWIYLLLLACPLMHLFHRHGGHGGHGVHRDRGTSTDSSRTRED